MESLENLIQIDESAFIDLKYELAQFIETELLEEGVKEFKAQFLIMFNTLVSSYNSITSSQRNFNETNEKLIKNLRNKNDICKRIEEDQERILNINQEFENLSLKIDYTKSEEQELDKQIKSLNDEIIKLNQIKEKDSFINFNPEEIELKEKLKADVDDLDIKFEQVISQKNQILKQLDIIISEKVKLEEIGNELESQKKETEEYKAKKYKEYEEQIEKKINIDNLFKNTKNDNMEFKKRLIEQDETLSKLREKEKNINNENDEIIERISECEKLIKKLQSERPLRLKEIKELDKKKEEFEKSIKEIGQEITNIEKEKNELTKETEEFEKNKLKFEFKINEYDKEIIYLKEEIDKIHLDVLKIEKEIEMKKLLFHEKKDELNSKKQKDHEEKKKIEDLSDELNTQHNQNIFIENSIRRLMNEALGIKKETQLLEQQKEIIEAEKNIYSKQSSDAQMEFFQAKERLKNLNEAIGDLKEKNTSLEQKAKQQKKIFEAVKGDCLRFEKKYSESKKDIKEISDDKQKKSQRYQFLKIELNYKQKLLAGLQKNFSNNEIELIDDKEKKRLLIEEIKQIKISIERYQKSNNNLNKTISLAECDHQNQLKEFQVIVTERDFINQQLIQRHKEIDSLYEKIKVHQEELIKLNSQYEKKLIEVENLKQSRELLTEEYIKSENIIKNIFELRVTKIKIEKELIITKNKLKSLEDQTKKPLNIHRWTKLEYSDPEKFELITQINSLQRRLIAKTEEVSHKEELIQEKEKLYIKLKGIVARQSGVDMIESLKNYQKLIREENIKLKKMNEEVKYLSLTIRNYELEIKELDKKINQLKMDWIKSKRNIIREEN